MHSEKRHTPLLRLLLVLVSLVILLAIAIGVVALTQHTHTSEEKQPEQTDLSEPDSSQGEQISAPEEPVPDQDTPVQPPEEPSIPEDPSEADPDEAPEQAPEEAEEPAPMDPPEPAEQPADPTLARAQAILEEMTLEEKVGQLFFVRCPETEAAQKAADYHLGGYLLFGRDFAGKTEEEVIQTIQSYQDAVELPLLIGVDEEGGTVNRVSSNPNLRAVPFWSPQALYAEGGFDLIESDTVEKCSLLKRLGINVNFAPVCDVSQNPEDFIYARSFGRDGSETAAYVQLVVETMTQEGIASVLKHFPGYGSNVDTHTGIAYDDRPYETFQTTDFLPFQAGIDSGAGIVLVSHNIVNCMDSQSPASLSPEVHRILREELHFDGLIITDDLAMDGVRDFAADEQTAVLAVAAGNDLLCCTDFETQIPAVLEAVEEGTLSEERIDQSVLRILMYKISLGLLS